MDKMLENSQLQIKWNSLKSFGFKNRRTDFHLTYCVLSKAHEYFIYQISVIPIKPFWRKHDQPPNRLTVNFDLQVCRPHCSEYIAIMKFFFRRIYRWTDRQIQTKSSMYPVKLWSKLFIRFYTVLKISC